MSQQPPKKSGSRDINDLKARLGLKKGTAPAPVVGGAAPPPPTGRPTAGPAVVAPPGLTRPGLLVDLSRRLHQQDIAQCFNSVGPALAMHRGLLRGPNAAYTAYLVSGPRSDLIAQGCPNELGKNLQR